MSSYSFPYEPDYQTDYPPSAQCIECNSIDLREDMKQCEGCDEWMCVGCVEKGKVCATCKAEA
jgi:hypothetical protein